MKHSHLAVAVSAAVLTALVIRPAAAQNASATPPAMRHASAIHHDDPAFTRIAPKVHASVTRLEREFEKAQRGNPTLTRPEFLTAAVLSQNLIGDHPDITTHAILQDLQRGRDVRRSLEGLGLTRPAAVTAVHEAQLEVDAAERTTPSGRTNQDSTRMHSG